MALILETLAKASLLALTPFATFVLEHLVWDCIKPIPRRGN